jgi:hypothetical protein
MELQFGFVTDANGEYCVCRCATSGKREHNGINKNELANYSILSLHWGHAVAYLAEVLCYKPEGRRFESRMWWIFFNLPNPSIRITALGSTQPLTEMSTRSSLGVKAVGA